MRIKVSVLIGLFLLATVAANAQTVNLGDTQDTSIASGALATQNLTSSPEFLINWSPPPSSSQGLIQFDLSTLPANATINNATLTLFHEFNDGNGKVYNFFRNTTAWNESTVTFDTRPSIDPTAVSSLTINDTSAAVFRTFNLTTVVQGWYAGTFANDGLTLMQNPDAAAWIYFQGRRAPNGAQRPVLTINFTTSAVPEPGSLAFLAGLGVTGSLITLRRLNRRHK